MGDFIQGPPIEEGIEIEKGREVPEWGDSLGMHCISYKEPDLNSALLQPIEVRGWQDLPIEQIDLLQKMLNLLKNLFEQVCKKFETVPVEPGWKQFYYISTHKKPMVCGVQQALQKQIMPNNTFIL